MTQALAVHEILCRSGHELVGVVVGSVGPYPTPEYVSQGFPVPITPLPSPSFALRNGRSVNMLETAWQALADHSTWWRSIAELRLLIDRLRPDLVLNFFEPLTGLLQLLRPLDVPVVSVAHQHMIGHPAHHTPLTGWVDEWGLRLFASFVGYRSWKLALSLYPAPDRGPKTVVGPPLLRRELFRLEPTPGDYVLAYLANHGYHEEFRAWHRAHPGTELHCFYDRPGCPEMEQAAPNLTFHRLDGAKFLRMMAGCRAVVSTAGFDLIGEAAWLGKPVYLVPVEGHAEQKWNARDAVQAGLGMSDERFNLDRIHTLPRSLDARAYRDWVASAETTLERVIERSRGDVTVGGRR